MSGPVRPSPPVQVAVLGPLEVRDGAGALIDVGAPKQRAVMAALALEPGRVVPMDRLIDRVWGEDPPAAVLASLHGYVAQLRRSLEPDRPARAPAQVVVTRSAGYLLAVAPEAVDAQRFATLVAQAEQRLADGDAAGAYADLDAALALWRGEPLPELADHPSIRPEVERLRILRSSARQLRIEALLDLGRFSHAAEGAESLVRDDPLRERGWAQLMMARYQEGRTAEALRVYQSCRRLFRDELGLEPGPALRRLEASILDHDLDDMDPRPLASAPAARPQREPGQPHEPVVVGRHAERGTLFTAMKAAAAGHGRCVVIEGEAGIGKTTLAGEAASHAAALGMRVVWARAVGDLGAPSLWLWQQVARQLGFEQAIDHGGHTDAPQARFEHLERLSQLLIDAVSDGSLLVVLDDLHWADASSLQLLRLVAASSSRVGLAVVATLRPSDAGTDAALEDTLVAIGREHHARRLVLEPLSSDDVADFLRAHHDDLVAWSPELHHRTGGNPFFLTEVIRLIDQRGAVDERAVPATVKAVVEQRVSRLPRHEGDLLRLAAVGGNRIDVDVLAMASGQEIGEVAGALDRAAATGLLSEEEGWTWRFGHDLAREALANGLSPVARARLHGQIADAIEVVYQGSIDQHLEDLARHRFHAAGRRPSVPAHAACSAAADRSRTRHAYDQAARHRARALATLPSGPDTDPDRYGTLLALTREQRLAGDVVSASESLAQALEVARRLDDPERIAEALAVLGEPTLWNWRPYGHVDPLTVELLHSALDRDWDDRRRAELLGTLAVELYYGPERAKGVAHAMEAVAIARRLHDPAVLGRALNNLVIAAWQPDHEGLRREATDEALTLAGRGLPMVTELIARMHRLAVALRFADPSTYHGDLDRCGVLVPAVGVPELEAQFGYQLAGRALLEGDPGVARELAERAFHQQRRTSLWGAQWCRLVQLVTLHRHHGGLEQVAGELVDLAHQQGYGPLRPTAVLVLCELEDRDTARRLRRSWDLSPDNVLVDWASDFHLAQLGEIAAVLEEPDPKACYRALLPFADRVVVAGTAIACWGSTHGTLGRLASALGDSEATNTHRAAAVAVDRVIGPDAARSRSAVEFLRDDRGHHPVDWSPVPGFAPY